MSLLASVKYAATVVQVPVDILIAICTVESGLNPQAYNKYDGKSPSYGLCQVKYDTAKWMGYKGDKRGLFNPDTNSLYAAKYLKYQLNRYQGNLVKAVSAYNRGNANRANVRYVRKVFKTMLGEVHVGYRCKNQEYSGCVRKLH